MQDVIKREVTIKAPKERVYAAIADPKQLTKWFPDRIEGNFSEGEQPFFVFEGQAKAQTYIEKMQPYEYFAFRWRTRISDTVVDVLKEPNTLVEFRIKEIDGVCAVTMTESGFASLPTDIAEASFKRNDGGWTFMLDRLEKYFKGQ